VPAGAVEQQRGMRAPRQGRGEAVEEDLHRAGPDFGHDQREGLVRAGLDGAI
jgi:hypothetical protein